MNFVVIVSDTFRRDHLGVYGNEWISTPHLDAFAEKSLVFDRAYTASFPTVPNRHDLLTGRFTATYIDWAPLPPEETVLAQVLSDTGYTTMMISDTNHTLENGYNYQRGFDGFEWIRGQEGDFWKTGPAEMSACDPKMLRKFGDLPHYRNRAGWRYESDTFVARTMTAAGQWLEDNRSSRPFFLYVDTFDPHEPWDPPAWYVDRYDPGYTGKVIDYPHYDHVEGYLSPEELKHCRALYAGEVTLVDRWVGMLLEKIEDMRLMENTMVIFTADHGFLHGEHGIIGKALQSREASTWSHIPLYDEISHIPFILWMPGVNPGRSDAVIQPPDIMPTILDAAVVEIPPAVQGESFLKVVKGGRNEHRQRAFSFGYAGGADALATVTEGKWQATLFPMKTPTGDEQVSYAVDGLAKQFRAGGDTGEDRLYDLQADPEAQKDVSNEHADVMAELRRRFVDLLVACETGPDIVTRWKVD